MVISTALLISLAIAGLAGVGIYRGASKDEDIADDLEDLGKKLTGSGMTRGDKEYLDYQDAIADENADDALERTRILNQEFGPAWQIQETAKGFDSVGLNRMLMAGSSPGVSASTSSQSAGMPSGTPSSTDIGNLLSAVVGAFEANSRIKSTNAEAAVRKQTALGLEIDNKYKEELNKIELENRRADYALKNANIAKINADRELTELAAFYYPQLQNSVIAKNYADVDKAVAEADKLYSDIIVNEAEVNRIYSEVEKNKHEMSQLDALAAKLRQETKLLVEETNLTHERIDNVKESTKKIKQEAKLIGKQIGLAEKDIEFYLMNHIRILDAHVSDSRVGLDVTYFDPKTGKVVNKGAGLFPPTKVKIYDVPE